MSSSAPPPRSKKDNTGGDQRTRAQSQSQVNKKSKLHSSSKPTKHAPQDHKQHKHSPQTQRFHDDPLDLVDSESTRLEKFGKLLAGPNTDMQQLKKLSWSGIPPAVRATTWQILLVSPILYHMCTWWRCAGVAMCTRISCTNQPLPLPVTLFLYQSPSPFTSHPLPSPVTLSLYQSPSPFTSHPLPLPVTLPTPITLSTSLSLHQSLPIGVPPIQY